LNHGSCRRCKSRAVIIVGDDNTKHVIEGIGLGDVAPALADDQRQFDS
jgi:hypothetical protein